MNVNQLFSLEGKTALVTGARTGIGQAIAVGLAAAGADVLLLGHRANMQETEEKIQQLGRKYQTVLCDLSQPQQVEGFCQDLLAEHHVDILVNNAGIIHREPAVDHAYEQWQRVLDTNLNALFLLSQHIARPMLERGQGKLINIASLLSFQGGITVPSYAASKHAVAGLTKALANEWAGQGVQVNAIAPGYIATNNTQALRENEERNSQILARIPTGRWGKADDLVGAAIFLASPASDYVNGHVLVVDGGWMAR